jgi:trafficking protein particle complex subunit 4
VAPISSLGIERLETDTLVIQCFQTLTGAKFVVTATPGTTELETFLQNIYEIYADYVLKVLFTLPAYPSDHCILPQNPFYEFDMPIRCDLFNKHLEKLVQKYGQGSRRRIG